jgi:hypothetical protein
MTLPRLLPDRLHAQRGSPDSRPAHHASVPADARGQGATTRATPPARTPTRPSEDLAAAPHLDDGNRLDVAWQQARRQLALAPDCNARARLALESTLADALRRVERLEEEVRPWHIKIVRGRPAASVAELGRSPLRTTARFPHHSQSMIFGLRDNGVLHHAFWRSP